MNKVLVCVLVCVLACVVSADPARPAISDQFYSEVHVAINDNDRYVVGGGILAFDVPKLMSRTDFKLENSQHELEVLHILERYDLHEIFEIYDNQACKTIKAMGTIESPFAWVAKAEYNGTTSYHGRDHDMWVLNLSENGDVFEQRLYVDSQNVDIPAYFTTHNKTGNVVNDVAVTFLSFDPKEPQSWVFEIPTTCNNSLGTYGACNAGQVVYWANANWNCANVACSSRVPAGSGQPSYACAEFTARSLAAGGYMLNLQPTSPQSSYGNFRGYNLLLVSGLSGFCGGVGYSPKPASPASVQAAYAIMGNAGEGSMSHACIGVGSGHNDCHNNARLDYPSADSFYLGVNNVWAPPGC